MPLNELYSETFIKNFVNYDNVDQENIFLSSNEESV
jgi:hypothetical protein